MSNNEDSTCNGRNDSVFDSTESQHDTSVRIQKSYKDLIRKLENTDMIGMDQSGIIGSMASSSQRSVNENKTLKVLMDEAHHLYKNVQGPHEARLDARVLKGVSRICRLHSHELSVNQQKFQVSYVGASIETKLVLPHTIYL